MYKKTEFEYNENGQLIEIETIIINPNILNVQFGKNSIPNMKSNDLFGYVKYIIIFLVSIYFMCFLSTIVGKLIIHPYTKLLINFLFNYNY